MRPVSSSDWEFYPAGRLVYGKIVPLTGGFGRWASASGRILPVGGGFVSLEGAFADSMAGCLPARMMM